MRRPSLLALSLICSMGCSKKEPPAPARAPTGSISVTLGGKTATYAVDAASAFDMRNGYNRQGVAFFSGSLRSDEVLGTQGANRPAMAEVPAAAQPAPAKAAAAPGGPSEYEQRFISFDEIIGVNQTGAVVLHQTRPVEGIYRRPLGGMEFYNKVGRPDLAHRFAARRGVGIGLLVTGSMAVVGGLGMAFGGVSMTIDTQYGCRTYSSSNASKCVAYSDVQTPESMQRQGLGRELAIAGGAVGA